jgi:hypothetical protein
MRRRSKSTTFAVCGDLDSINAGEFDQRESALLWCEALNHCAGRNLYEVVARDNQRLGRASAGRQRLRFRLVLGAASRAGTSKALVTNGNK